MKQIYFTVCQNHKHETIKKQKFDTFEAALADFLNWKMCLIDAPAKYSVSLITINVDEYEKVAD